MDTARWEVAFRVTTRSAAPLRLPALRSWWSVFPDQPGSLLTDGSLLLVAVVVATTPRQAVLLGRHRVTEFFPGPSYRVDPLALERELW